MPGSPAGRRADPRPPEPPRPADPPARSSARDDDRWTREPGPRGTARPRQFGFEVTDDRWN